MAKQEKYVIERVERKTITEAPYNPRTMTSEVARRLAEVVKNIGLLGTIVVNRRTGYVISGHQRLRALDHLEGSDNYALDVAMVDLDPKAEMEQNIFFNNEFAQGSWDQPRLRNVLNEVNFEHAGFTEKDVRDMFNASDITEVLDAGRVETSRAESEREATEREIERATTAPARARRQKREAQKNALVIFENRQRKEEFLGRLGVDRDLKYISAAQLITNLKAAIGIA